MRWKTVKSITDVPAGSAFRFRHQEDNGTWYEYKDTALDASGLTGLRVPGNPYYGAGGRSTDTRFIILKPDMGSSKEMQIGIPDDEPSSDIEPLPDEPVSAPVPTRRFKRITL